MALSNIILDGGVEKGLSEIMNFTNANRYGWTYTQLMNTWKRTKQELEENGVLEVPYPNNSNKKLGIDIIDDRLEYSVKAITGLEISDFDAYGEGAQIIKAIRKLFINEWQKIAADKGLKVESAMSLSEAKQELREHGYKLLKEDYADDKMRYYANIEKRCDTEIKQWPWNSWIKFVTEEDAEYAENYLKTKGYETEIETNSFNEYTVSYWTPEK